MTRKTKAQLAGLVISQGLLLVLALIGLLVVGPEFTAVHAASINVDDQGTDSPTCGEPEAPCQTIPYALANRAVPGDTVFVWAGTYTETITLRAGIVISGAGATSTFIDGEGVRGPMVSASGTTIDSSTVLRGVTIRRGSAADGGGIRITSGASPLIEDCIVSENTATSRGGGLYVFGSAALTLRNTDVLSNTSASAGGGMYQSYSGGSYLELFGGRFENNESTGGNGGGLWIAGTVVLTGTEFVNNMAAYRGGGLYQSGTAGHAVLIGGLLEGNSADVYHGGGLGAEGTAILSATQVIGNRAGQLGGGLWANYAQVTRGLFVNNWSNQRGGGLFADYSVVMTATSMISNTAPQQGGAVGTYRDADIVNSLFARNAAFAGSAIWMWGSSPVEARLRHLTIVSPTVGSAYPSAAAILVHGETTATITNTIVGGYPYAIEAFSGGTVYEDYNLFYNLGTSAFNENGGLIYSGGHSLNDLDPSFVNPSGDDYHLSTGSPAIDAGIDIGVTEDIDGDLRVPGFPPDIGADEVVPVLAVDKAGPTWFNLGDQITYVLTVTNSSIVTAHNVTVTDTVPAGASFIEASHSGTQSSGEVSWPAFNVAPGGSVSRTFIVTATATITNDDYLATAQGYPGVAGVRAVISTLNQPPLADAGTPQTVHSGMVTLNGSGSADPEGSALLYYWVQTDGATVTLSDPTAASPTFTAPLLEGELTFQLTVTDTLGAFGSDTTTVTIANAAPSADAGDPQTVHSGTVTLDGSGSSDPDGDALLYHWVQTDGAAVTLSDPAAVGPTFTAPLLEGDLTFQLTVTDTFGAVGTDTTIVTVGNAAPSADAGDPQTVHSGTVTLDGSGSSDPEGDALLYHWVQTDGAAVTLSDPAAAGPTFTAPLLEGELTFQLTVTDTFGAAGSDTTIVTVGNAAPSADAGDPQELRPGSVTLDGSGSSDPDGDAILYHWVQTGGTAVTLSDPTATSPTFDSPILDDLLTFQLTVTDTFGAVGSDTTTVTIVNAAPSADAGDSQTVHSGTVTLDGSGSADLDGDALLYLWVQTGGTLVGLSDPTVADPTFTAPLLEGELTFQLTVTDTFGAVDSDITIVTVGNAAPSADAGDPQNVHSGTVTLDGSGSSDPEGDALLYHWVQTDGAAVTLSDPAAIGPSFTVPLLEGDLTFQLTVTDTFGAVGTDTTIVTVGNTGPIADAGDPQTVHSGTVTLDGSGSTDPDGDALLYHWVQTDGAAVTLSDPAAAGPTFTAPLLEGDLTFQLTVTDTFGAVGTDTTIVTVGNAAPSADAGDPQTVHSGTVTLDGSGSSDPEGDALLYHWVQTDGAAVTLSDPAAAGPTFTAPLLAGDLTFQLTVTDTFGAVGTDTTTVTVGNAAPSADAGDPQTVHSGTVTLDGSGSSDPEGDALLYHWVQTDGAAVTLSDPAAAGPTFTAPLEDGDLAFQLTVTDTFGAADSDTTTVTVGNAAPSADAGDPQTVHIGTVTLDGSGSSDPEGDALLYHWVQTGGTLVGLSDPTAVTPSFPAPLLAGDLTFQLTVTDTFGAVGTDTTIVTVGNAAPSADAGDPQELRPGSVTLDGSGSSDPDGDAILHHWVQTGGTAVTLSDPTATSPTFDSPILDDLLTFQLTVTDTFGAVGSDTTIVTIVNTAPSADAGDPQTVHSGTVTLDGSGSTDPDGDALLYHWMQIDGVGVTLSDPAAVSPSFIAPLVAGDLTFRLTVTDTFGAVGTDTTTVTVGNAAPSADAGDPQTVHSGTVTLDGSGSSDPEGDALLYHWVQTDGAVVTLSDPTAAGPTFTAPLLAGDLTFQLTVTDTFGAVGTDTTIVTVGNAAPIADAGDPQNVHSGTVTLNGSGSTDPDGDALLYHWVQTDGIEVTLSDPSAAGPTFTAPLEDGELTFQLTVTDTFGAADSDTTTVTVGNAAPSADAGDPQTVHSGTVTLDGSGSTDPEGDALFYHWVQIDGVDVTLNDPAAVSPSFTAPLLEGELTFQLTVTDTFGAVDSDTTTVTIANQGPEADAGPDLGVLPDSVVTLDGSASNDPDGDQLLFHWVQIAGQPVTLSDPDAVDPTFTAPSSPDLLAFSLTVTDTFEAPDSDTIEVHVALPELAILKSGPSAVLAGELITYTLVITNNAPVAASSLVITDVIPVGANLASVSDGGGVDNGMIVWIVPSLGPTDWLSRTFTVTATETITNSDYGVSCAEGVTMWGNTPVVTKAIYRFYLPVILRGF